MKASGISQAIDPQALDLFLSPTVGDGSAVLELFGSPREAIDATEPIDQEIVDTPVDVALARVFTVLDAIDTTTPIDHAGSHGIDGPFGKRLFGLSTALIDGDVHLDLTWQRPRGTSRAVSVTQAKAQHLKDLLDVETTAVTHAAGVGQLVSMSTDGQIRVRLDCQPNPLALTAEGFDSEDLRGLWARNVTVRWVETTVSHPQRDSSRTTRKLERIQPSVVATQMRADLDNL